MNLPMVATNRYLRRVAGMCLIQYTSRSWEGTSALYYIFIIHRNNIDVSNGMCVRKQEERECENVCENCLSLCVCVCVLCVFYVCLQCVGLCFLVHMFV